MNKKAYIKNDIPIIRELVRVGVPDRGPPKGVKPVIERQLSKSCTLASGISKKASNEG